MENRSLGEKLCLWQKDWANVPMPTQAMNELYNIMHSSLTDATKQRTNTSTCFTCVRAKKKCQYFSEKQHCERCDDMPSLCFKYRLSDAVIYNKWTHDLYQGRRRFMNIQREYIEPIGLSIRHFEDGPFLQVVAMPFQTPDETAMVSYKKSSEHWDTFTSKPVALGHIDRGFFDKYLEKCIKHFLLRYEKHPVIEQLLRQKEQLCVKATYLFGMLGLLMRGWYEDCVPAPEVLASQMDSLLEFKIATLETALLNKLQDNLSLNNTMSNSLVMLAILVLLERDLWRLMHWALYGNNAPDWKHPTRAPDLMRATLQQAQAILGLFHSVGQWPFDTSSFHRPVRYDPLDSTSLDNSLLCEAFDVKKTPEKAGEVIASLTYDNFIQSYSPTVDEQSSDLGGQYIELSSNISMDIASGFHFVSQADSLRWLEAYQ